ncbi:MAG TPA: hypothetical protein PKY28_02880 [Ferruginibacter sp.]|nr:hypothetical protein [Chitinophagaceae bacterium]HQW92010.1 hypothetical protein [Ferruginibacter sp.]
MIKSLIIKKIIAVVFLIVFAFSITPTIVFHNWLADHADTVKHPACSNGEQLGKRTFNCHCDNIVAESPFTDISKEIQFAVNRLFSPEKVEKPIHFLSSPHTFFLLRGPPLV